MTSNNVQAWLRHVVADRIANGRAITEIRRAPFPHIGSYQCERVFVALANGERMELFLKDYGQTRQSKDQPIKRRIRELRVYGELLDGAGLGTPTLFGIMHDEHGDQCYLLLELVNAEVVEQVDARNGYDVVRWLAHMQAQFLNCAHKLGQADYLIQHDARYYEAKAAAAEHDAVTVAPRCAPEVRTITARYADSIASFCEAPGSLVHGGFIPWHIFVDRGVEPRRVCVVDWELAGFGSTLYDLAIFVDDAPPALRTDLCKVYRDAARLEGVPVADFDELMTSVNAFRLHRVVDWLSRAVEKGYTPEKIDWLVARGKSLTARVHR
jgi:aminoglycoside phosphotransferase (APT) family kinase protein